MNSSRFPYWLVMLLIAVGCQAPLECNTQTPVAFLSVWLSNSHDVGCPAEGHAGNAILTYQIFEHGVIFAMDPDGPGKAPFELRTIEFEEKSWYWDQSMYDQSNVNADLTAPNGLFVPSGEIGHVWHRRGAHEHSGLGWAVSEVIVLDVNSFADFQYGDLLQIEGVTYFLKIGNTYEEIQ